MRPGSLYIVGKWRAALKSLGETGMGYTVVDIHLIDGRVFKQVVVDTGCVYRIRGRTDIPFTEDDIAYIRQTNEKWDWKETP